MFAVNTNCHMKLFLYIVLSFVKIVMSLCLLIVICVYLRQIIAAFALAVNNCASATRIFVQSLHFNHFRLQQVQVQAIILGIVQFYSGKFMQRTAKVQAFCCYTNFKFLWLFALTTTKFIAFLSFHCNSLFYGDFNDFMND